MAANTYIVCGRCGAAGHHYTLCRGEVRPDLTLSQVVVECAPQPIIPGETRWLDLDSFNRGLGAWNSNMGLWINSFSDFLEQVEEMSKYFDASTCSVNPYSEGIKVIFDVPGTRMALAVAERIAARSMNETVPTSSIRPTRRRRPAQGSGDTTRNSHAHSARLTISLNSSQPRVNPTRGSEHGNTSIGSNRPIKAPKLTNQPDATEQQSATNSSSLEDSDNDMGNTGGLSNNSLLNSPFEPSGVSRAPHRQPRTGYSTRQTPTDAPSSLETVSMAPIPSSSLPRSSTGATATNRRIIPPRRRRPGTLRAGSSLRRPSSGPAEPDQHNLAPSIHKTVRFVEVEPTLSAASYSPHSVEPQGISAEGYDGETPGTNDHHTSQSNTRGTTQLAGKKRTFVDVEFNTDVDFEVDQSDGSSEE